ncbi:DNA-binding transcriptional regulator, ArsR family [Tindallia californiensis]|uniref:DNA-binding transcriptional regulator, ArsR family n=2 Tax=Tindallia californiensis TaxID=159292 RepID=A0A1H3MCP1_9FIRM|nr:DNA-binding transcriptional regulator, ArsR family [Tindallia californiensis]
MSAVKSRKKYVTAMNPSKINTAAKANRQSENQSKPSDPGSGGFSMGGEPMDKLVNRLRALADENRLKIIVLLLEKDYCVGALSKNLGISKAAVSQHMKILRENGIVKGEKRGYFTHYEVQKHQIKGISEELEEISRREFKKDRLVHSCQKNGDCHEAKIKEEGKENKGESI